MDMDAMVEAFVIYMDNAEAHMTPEQFEDFHRALDTNPVLKALERRYQEQQEGHPVQGEAEEKEGEDSSLA
jgi:NADH:ubiquinone oxidoreductase subunit